jgi:hypothetical protein
LLARGDAVTVYARFWTGQPHFLEQARRHPTFQLIEADLWSSTA